MDFHSMGKYTEDDLKRGQNEPRDEFGVKTINIFYDIDFGMMFCLLDAPDRYAVEKHHFGTLDRQLNLSKERIAILVNDMLNDFIKDALESD
jgi:hypothetical protein